MSEESKFNQEVTMTVAWSETDGCFNARLANDDGLVGKGETGLEALHDLEKKVYGSGKTDILEKELSEEGKKVLEEQWNLFKKHLEKKFQSKLRMWLTIGCFLAFTLGVLAGMGIVWVNDNWTPIGS